MRIIVNDFSGHPFQVELSRFLANNGHNVLHLFFSDFITPKGELQRRPDDPLSFQSKGISVGGHFRKETLLQRRAQEIQYGKLVAAEINQFGPDVFVACNNTLDAQRVIQRACRGVGASFVFWLQDLYSIGMSRILAKRLGALGGVVGFGYRILERHLLRTSDAVVAISDDFVPQLKDWGIDAEKVDVIENWAPLSSITVCPKENRWSLAHGLAAKKVALYTGTLGYKHDPQLLLELAGSLQQQTEVSVVVLSEGPVAEELARRCAQQGLTNLILLPFQDMAEYSQVLGTADVLLSVIEAEAGQYSVPSKVLSYLCSGRPIVLSAPPSNLASKIVARSAGGTVVRPGDRTGFLSAVELYLGDRDEAAARGACGRRYAEQEFTIARIGPRFTRVLERAFDHSPLRKSLQPHRLAHGRTPSVSA